MPPNRCTRHAISRKPSIDSNLSAHKIPRFLNIPYCSAIVQRLRIHINSPRPKAARKNGQKIRRLVLRKEKVDCNAHRPRKTRYIETAPISILIREIHQTAYWLPMGVRPHTVCERHSPPKYSRPIRNRNIRFDLIARHTSLWQRTKSLLPIQLSD